MKIEPKYHKKDTTYNIRGYIDYAKGVLNNEIVAGEYVRLACKRFIEWFDRDDMYFDVASCDKVINLIYKLKHTTGRFNNKPFKLLPWQQFLVANICGWRWKDTNLRVTRNVFCMVSRKNGKTCLMSAICIAALLVDGNHGAEIDFIANSSRQAGIAFNMTTNFCKSIDPEQKIFKRYRSEIRVPILDSKIQVLSSDSMTLDGYNSSICVLDEMHAMRDWSLYNVMKSSQGSRESPIMCAITTAGFLIGDTYPCYSMWQNSIDIMRGEKTDDTTFSMIFQMDEDDDWEDEKVWEKFCPSLNATVYKQYVRDEINSAKNNTSLETGVKTKTCNMWCQSESIWLPNVLIERQMQDFTFEQLRDMGADVCYIGVDLASVSDLTAISACVPLNGKFYIKSLAFLPEDCLDTGINHQLYREFTRRKELIVTSGNVTDYDFILDKIMEIDKVLTIQIVDYDAFNATQFAINATNLGLPMQPFSQALGHFNKFTKEFERQLRLGNIILHKSKITSWCFSNTTLMRDKNDNVKPMKSDAKSGKIDIVISAIESFAGAIYNDTNFFNMEVV